jgi:hypothetical protein
VAIARAFALQLVAIIGAERGYFVLTESRDFGADLG